MRLSVVFVLSLLLTSLPCRAQEATLAKDPSPALPDSVLSLEAAVARAQAQSPDAASARLSFQAEEARVRATQAAFLPSLAVTGSAPGLERSITDVVQDDGSIRYVEQSRTFSRANLSVAQVLPWTGTEINVRSGLSRIDQFGDRADVQQWQAAPVSIGLEQPLFQYNDDQWARRLAPMRYDVARKSMDEGLAEVAVTAVDRYFAVYIAQINARIAEFNVAVNDTIYTLSQGRYEIGRIAENELLQTELALLNARTARQEAKIELEEARQALRRTLGTEGRTPLTARPPTTLPPIRWEPEQAVEQARARHPDFAALKRRMTQARSEVAAAKGQTGFSATLVARYGLNQSAPTLNNAYRNPLDQQQFGISFRMPVYRWGEGSEQVDAAEAERERTRIEVQQERRTLEDEVYFQVLRVRQLRQQVKTAETADEVARRRFEVARNRYTVGKISITDLFNAQREKDQAQRAYARTLRDFWVEYYTLRQLTLMDL
jgi:outer membrane protein TolC